MSSTEPHDDRTIYIDEEGGTYSRSTPHVFKKRPVDLACYCGLDINDPVHTEGIDLSLPTFMDEIEEYVPLQHFYAGDWDQPCLVCNKAYFDPIHVSIPTRVPKAPAESQLNVPSGSQEQVEQLTQDNRVLRESNQRTEAYLKDLQIHSKNPHSFFTKGDKVVVGGLGVFFVANLTVGILNLVM